MEVKLKVECESVGHRKGWEPGKLLGNVSFGSTGEDAAENAKFFASTPSGLRA